MTLTPNQREELLEQLLAGDLDPSSDTARTAFAKDPSLRVEFEQFDALGTELADLGAAEQEILASLREEPPRWARNDRQRRRTVMELERRVTVSRRSNFRRLAPWLAAAAIVAIGVFLGWPDGSRREVDPNQFLGNETNAEIRAEGTADPFEVLSWLPTARFGEWFRVSVYTDDPAKGGKLLAQSIELDETSRWSPREDHEPAEVAVEQWPDRVWGVVHHHRDGSRSDIVARGYVSRLR